MIRWFDSTFFLKTCLHSISSLFINIMTSSFQSQTIPRMWLQASVIVICKKSDNYRPISQAPISCNIMESIICEKKTNFLLSHNVISHQHCFVNERSVLTNILTCIYDWSSALDKKLWLLFT